MNDQQTLSAERGGGSLERVVRCPSCGSSMTGDGQPSSRVFYACGPYGYDGLNGIRNQSELCEAWSEMKRIANLVRSLSDSPKSLLAHLTRWADDRFPPNDQALRPAEKPTEHS